MHWQLWLNQFFFSIEHTQGSKNSLADSVTREFANDDHQSRPPAKKGGNPLGNATATRTGYTF